MGGQRRATVRPRYGRIGAALSSVGVTSVAVLGGAGVLPSSAEAPPPQSDGAITTTGAEVRPRQQAPDPDTRDEPTAGSAEPEVVSPDATPGEREDPDAVLPADSGEGRRVVFSESRQRVWLVSGRERVQRTYLVSGSVSDNLDPGTYAVYSRSTNAVGIDDSGTMKWFVRFTQGDTGAAIGFHDIPVDEGGRVQSVAELGTATSHGCIRQRTPDAKAMWDFAGLGTAVVVTA